MEEASDKSSSLTENALYIAKELFDLLIRHFYEMVFVEPANVLCDEVGCNRKEILMRNLTGFSRMFEPTIGIGAFFPFASKIGTKLDGQILGEDIGCIDVGFF